MNRAQLQTCSTLHVLQYADASLQLKVQMASSKTRQTQSAIIYRVIQLASDGLRMLCRL